MAGEAGDRIDRGREALLRALSDGGVRFVVIGGAALQSHGQHYETEDIDVAPDRAQENLKRLADVLNRLRCHLEVDPDHPEHAVPLPDDYFMSTVLAQATVWNLRTVHGKLDLTLSPSGFPDGYTQLAPGAQRGRVAATTIEMAIASLADVEHSSASLTARRTARTSSRSEGSMPLHPRRARQRARHPPRTACFAPTRVARSCRPREPQSTIHRNATRSSPPHGIQPQPQRHRR